MEFGTYFSSLIDDVRIYNRTLRAEQIAALTRYVTPEKTKRSMSLEG